MIKKAQSVFQKADAIIRITDEIVEWGSKYGKRDKSPNDKSFFLGYSVLRIDDAQVSSA
jgi:hypothetical protein